MNEKRVFEELRSHLVKNIDEYTPFPKPYMGKNKIKAIVLGADPSTKTAIRFDNVFGLDGNDNRYFAGINKNLNAIGLTLDDVYVQNFCQNYFTKTTYEQKENWWRASAIWYLWLKYELNEKFDESVPLLVTSELILKRLKLGNKTKSIEYYKNPDLVPIQSDYLTSGRLVFPLYRHWRYNLQRPEWKVYKEKLKKYFA